MSSTPAILSTSPLLEARFLAWTGNTLAATSRPAAIEALCELSSAHDLSPEAYLELCEREPEQRQSLIDRLLIGTTWFMREPDTLLALAATFKRARSGGSGRVTLWSAACASGEEPYSLVMAFLDAGLDPLVLATDLSADARAATAAAEYRVDRLEDLPARWRQRYFEPSQAGYLRALPELRARVTVLPHNLFAVTRPPPGWGGFDAIVCRNVLLYFQRPEAERVLRELGELLRDDGYLVLSAAEQPLSWTLPTLIAEGELPILRRRTAAELQAYSDNTPLPSRLPGRRGDTVTPAPVATSAAPSPPSPRPATSVAERLRVIRATQREADSARALVLARQLAAEEPLEAAGHLTLGLLLKAAGQLGEAASALRRARFLFGEQSWMAAYTLAVCLESAGDDRDALEAYRQAAAILDSGGPSGLDPPEDNEPMLAATVLESCHQRITALQRM